MGNQIVAKLQFSQRRNGEIFLFWLGFEPRPKSLNGLLSCRRAQVNRIPIIELHWKPTWRPRKLLRLEQQWRRLVRAVKTVHGDGRFHKQATLFRHLTFIRW